MEESVGALMRLFSHASQNGLDQFTDGRIMVFARLRKNEQWSTTWKLRLEFMTPS